jgi:peptidoglycan hydrolase-like protein with peptidoglycan-binding domain
MSNESVSKTQPSGNIFCLPVSIFGGTSPSDQETKPKQETKPVSGQPSKPTTTPVKPSSSVNSSELKRGDFDDVACKKYPSKKPQTPGYVAGKKIEQLQKDLITVGIPDIGTADGDFGPKTETGVKKFQECALKRGRRTVSGSLEVDVTFKGSADGIAAQATLDELELWLFRGHLIPELTSTSVNGNQGNTKTEAPANGTTASETNIDIKYEQASITPINSKAKSALTNILKEAKINTVTITSTVRTPKDQARVMYENLINAGVAAQKKLYGTNGDKVIDKYVELKDVKKTADEIKKGMEDLIVKLGSTTISKHCCDPNEFSIFDVAPSSIPSAKRKDFEAALKNSLKCGEIQKYIPWPDDPAYHIEVKL